MGFLNWLSEDKRWGAQMNKNLSGLTPVDSGLRGVSRTFSDWEDIIDLSAEERTAIADARRGADSIRMSRSKQWALVRKARKAEAEFKKQQKADKEQAKWDKRTGTKRR